MFYIFLKVNNNIEISNNIIEKLIKKLIKYKNIKTLTKFKKFI